MAEKKVIQVLLKCENSQMTTWIDADPRVKIGCTLTLKECPKKVWTVRNIYSESDKNSLKTDWTVGGLTKKQKE